MIKFFCNRCGIEIETGKRQTLQQSTFESIGHLRGCLDSDGKPIKVRSKIEVSVVYMQGGTLGAAVCDKCKADMIARAIILNPATRKMVALLMSAGTVDQPAGERAEIPTPRFAVVESGEDEPQ